MKLDRLELKVIDECERYLRSKKEDYKEWSESKILSISLSHLKQDAEKIYLRKGVNFIKEVFGNFKIPLSPLHEQQRIASILSAVDEKIEKEETKKKSLEELFKSLLNNLMTGKLRVNHLEV